MDLQTAFNTTIKKGNLFRPNDLLLLAVSGGVDSVVLCELCYRAGFDFILAHCNFQLRADESDRDEAFVNSLGEKYNKPVLVKRFLTLQYAEENKVSVQVAARELRYSWFNELLSGPAPVPAYIVTAHHANDNVETVLMNFFKGTGISGLRGILPAQGKLIRPLLNFRKEELLEFARAQSLAWVEDSSNTSDKYSRNFLRHQVIPLVEKIYPQAVANIQNSITRFGDAELLYQQSVARHKKKLLEWKGNELHIPVLKLQQSQPVHTILYEIIRDFNFTPHQTEDVLHLLTAESGRFVQSPSHRIIRNRKWLIIAPLANNEAEHILIEEGDRRISLATFDLSFTRIPSGNYSEDANNNLAQLDVRFIKYPLLLRKWKAGDYFYPLGMKKKKKLARFFIDQKLSKTEKENIWIVESDKKILWVVGHRIDDRFKVTGSTTSILQISQQSK